VRLISIDLIAYKVTEEKTGPGIELAYRNGIY
jgi:hypothetical protein